MPHYKDPENKVHFLDSEEFEYLLPVGCIRITDEEAVILTTPLPVPESVLSLEKIAEIERQTLMNRAVREFMLLSAEATAAAHGVTPANLYLVNPAYKAVKDVDTQIAALRVKL